MERMKKRKRKKKNRKELERVLLFIGLFSRDAEKHART